MIEVTREILRSVAGAAPRWSRMGLIALGAALIALPLLPGAPSDAAPTGSSGTAFPRVRGQTPWLVVACNFDDQRVAPANRSELEKFYSKAGAGHGYLVDYWDEVSFHQLDISGTKVTEWSVASHPEDLSKPLSRGEWQELSQLDKIRSCVNGPHGVNTDAYFGVVAVFPETKGTTATAISGTSRTVRLSNTADFPTGARPFMMAIGREWVRVTGTSDGAYTVDRGQVPPGEKEASTAAAHPAGTPVGLPGDLGAPFTGPWRIRVRGERRLLGMAIHPHDVSVTLAAHEMGHGFGFDHSRKYTRSTDDYEDCTDIMSAMGCVHTFGSPARGPGLTAINLERERWIPEKRIFRFEGIRAQSTLSLHSLSNPDALEDPAPAWWLVAHMPFALRIQNDAVKDSKDRRLDPEVPPKCSPDPNSCTTSDYLTVEFRQRSGWDRGFPRDAVVLHLATPDKHSYWMDKVSMPAPVRSGRWFEWFPGGLLGVGDEWVHAPLLPLGVRHPGYVYIGVNRFGPGPAVCDLCVRRPALAQVTLSHDRIHTRMAPVTGPSAARSGDQVTVTTNLQVSPSGAPIPFKTVSIGIGHASCQARVDENGGATCRIHLSQPPGTYTTLASFEGSPAYRPTSSPTGTFTVLPPAGRSGDGDDDDDDGRNKPKRRRGGAKRNPPPPTEVDICDFLPDLPECDPGV